MDFKDGFNSFLILSFSRKHLRCEYCFFKVLETLDQMNMTFFFCLLLHPSQCLQWEGHQRYYTCPWSGPTCTQPIRGVSIVADLRRSLSLSCKCLSTMSDAYLISFLRQSRLWHELRIELCSQCFLFLCSQPLHV